MFALVLLLCFFLGELNLDWFGVSIAFFFFFFEIFLSRRRVCACACIPNCAD